MAAPTDRPAPCIPKHWSILCLRCSGTNRSDCNISRIISQEIRTGAPRAIKERFCTNCQLDGCKLCSANGATKTHGLPIITAASEATAPLSLADEQPHRVAAQARRILQGLVPARSIFPPKDEFPNWPDQTPLATTAPVTHPVQHPQQATQRREHGRGGYNGGYQGRHPRYSAYDSGFAPYAQYAQPIMYHPQHAYYGGEPTFGHPGHVYTGQYHWQPQPMAPGFAAGPSVPAIADPREILQMGQRLAALEGTLALQSAQAQAQPQVSNARAASSTANRDEPDGSSKIAPRELGSTNARDNACRIMLSDGTKALLRRQSEISNRKAVLDRTLEKDEFFEAKDGGRRHRHEDGGRGERETGEMEGGRLC